jgi:hypothetical protein
MNELIVNFLEKQKCASIACIDGNGKPYCFNCFYAFDKENAFLYFKSSADTFHIKLLMQNPPVSGTILESKLRVWAVKGIQFQGTLLPLHHTSAQEASTRYHSIYPFAIAMPGDVWSIQLHSIKMTNNKAGFGNKILWTKNEPDVEQATS